MTSLAYTDNIQIDETEEWVSDDSDYCEEYFYQWDDDSALEEYSLGCAFGFDDY